MIYLKDVIYSGKFGSVNMAWQLVAVDGCIIQNCLVMESRNNVEKLAEN